MTYKIKAKKRGADAEAGASTSNTPLSKVISLQKALAASADLNPLQDLLETVLQVASSFSTSKKGKAKEDAESLKGNLKALHVGVQVLQRIFVALLKEDRIPLSLECDEFGRAVGGLPAGAQADSPEAMVSKWLQGRWNALVLLFASVLGFQDTYIAGEEEIRKEVLDALVRLQVEASGSLSRQVRKKQVSTEGSPDAPLPQWCPSPWRTLVLALTAGTPAFSTLDLKTDEGIKESFKKFGADGSAPPTQDIRQKFADDLLESFDDARYAALREISAILRNPPPAVAACKALRSNTLSLLVLLTAVPAQQADLNGFLIEELSRFRKGIKSKGGKGKRKFGEDGDSDDGAEEEDGLAEDWFSDSDEESGGQKKATKKVKLTSNGSAAALGNRAVQAKKAAKNRRRGKSALPFHEAVHSLPQQKAAFSNAWLALLLPGQLEDGTGPIGGRLSLTQTHEVLLRLHIQILPHLVKPNMLLDWLVDSVDAGGATSLLALNGLFTLMTQHNLDYPAFYTKLYALLGGTSELADGDSVVTASVLHMRYRSRFLRLLETFLSSTHLPAALVASFAKRLSRLALRSPPAAIVSIVPLIWTLLKRHPQCMRLIHRDFSSSGENGSLIMIGAAGDKGLIDKYAAGPAGLNDPYDPKEPDPNRTNALESSLWELASLGASLAAAQNAGRDAIGLAGVGGQSHWLHSVTTLSRILAEPFTKERYDLEDFLDITYATLFETETAPTLKPSEKRKRNPPPPPPLAYKLPESQLPGQKTYRAFLSRSALDRIKEAPSAGDDAATAAPQSKLDIMDAWTF